MASLVFLFLRAYDRLLLPVRYAVLQEADSKNKRWKEQQKLDVPVDRKCSVQVAFFLFLIGRISAALLKLFNDLQNLISGPSSSFGGLFGDDVIFLKDDATNLDNQLKTNAALPSLSRRSVRAVKQEFVRRVLDEQQHRRSLYADASNTPTTHLYMKVSLLDLSRLGPARLAPFPVEPYILIRDEYGKAMDILRSQCFSDGTNWDWLVLASLIPSICTLTTAHRT
jgi:hypothetical protein